MRGHYDHARVQEYWQHVWEREDVYSCPDDAEDPTYVLAMFPYTSGSLHMGHVRNYAITDAYARFRRMQGDTVLHPMGWDAFGLPAENAAHDRLTDPESWTRSCIERMREDMEELGLGYDWDREVTTCDPEYYQWNQWLFSRLLEEGLVDYREASVNWCPDCETVLADAQVESAVETETAEPASETATDGAGVCWRCGTTVEPRDVEQWFLRTTEFADELHDALDELEGWPDSVRNIQRDWIGRREGAQVTFDLSDSATAGDVTDLDVFTARLDTVHGASYVAVSPDHDVVEAHAAADGELAAALDDLEAGTSGAGPARGDGVDDAASDVGSAGGRDDATAGVDLGVTVEHPLTGEALQVYAAPYVLEDVGTGAVMGVPAHDERDHAFATVHDLPIRPVVAPMGRAGGSSGGRGGSRGSGGSGSGNGGHDYEAAPFTEDGQLTDAAGEYAGLASPAARERLLEDLDAAEPATTYRLRDWLVSRQRYWGTPIPIVHCPDCGRVPVPDEDLPVELPEFEHTTGNPLDAAEEWKSVTCPECGHEDAERETDTMDTFVDSSWYFLRYVSPDLEDAPFDGERASDWLPVDVYVGGEEHAVLHLLYIRFFARALSELGLLDVEEPVERLVNQGTVLHGGEQMSKRTGNVVAPHEYGAETTRLFVLSAAHPQRDFEWTARDVGSAYDLQQDVYGLVVDFVERPSGSREREPRDDHLDRAVDRALDAVAEAYESFRFHRAVAEIRELVTLCNRYAGYGEPHEETYHRALRALAATLAPLTPYLGEELWNLLRCDGLVAEADWPEQRTDGPRERADAERRLVDSTLADVREIVEVVDIDDPEHVELVVAEPWKYRAYELAREADRGDPIVGTVRGDEAVPDSDEAAEFAAELENREGGLEPVVDGDRAIDLLEDAAWLLDDEFGAEVTVRRATKDDELAAKAEPDRPAIHIE